MLLKKLKNFFLKIKPYQFKIISLDMKRLEEIKRQSPFRVPENYFDEVKSKIISAATAHEPESKDVSRSVRLRPLLRIAAFIAGFIIAIYFLLRSFQPGIEQDLSMQEIPDSYLNEIDIGTLEEIGATTVLSDEVPEVNKSEIIDYLLMDDVKLNEIYEQL
jgi:hypothetical protein